MILCMKRFFEINCEMLSRMTEICVLKCHGFELNTDLFRLLTRVGTIKKDPKVTKCWKEPKHSSILQRNMVKVMLVTKNL